MRWGQMMVWMTGSRSQLLTTRDSRRLTDVSANPKAPTTIQCNLGGLASGVSDARKDSFIGPVVYLVRQCMQDIRWRRDARSDARTSMRLGGAWKGMDVLSVFGLHGGTLTSA